MNAGELTPAWPSHRQAKSPGSPWVLVVEDDADSRDLVLEVLNEAGYGAEGVAGGEDALAILRRKSPCLVLVDLLMQDMDGRELVTRTRQLLGEAAPAFVFVTGVDQSRLDDVSSTILSKPLDIDQLLGVVAHHCGN